MLNLGGNSLERGGLWDGVEHFSRSVFGVWGLSNNLKNKIHYTLICEVNGIVKLK